MRGDRHLDRAAHATALSSFPQRRPAPSKRFARISLAAGESREVRLTLYPDDFAFYDQRLQRVIEPGTFTIYTGTSSATVQETVVRMTGATRVLDARPLPFR